MTLPIALRSEYFKIKRTAPLYFTLAAAAFSPFMSTLDLIFDGVDPDHRADVFNEMFTTKFMVTAAVVFPIFIILLCTLLAQIEYKNNTWKQVLTAPHSKGSIYLAKFATVHVFILIFLVVNLLFTLVSGVVLHFVEPTLQVLYQPLNGVAILNTVLNSYAALLGLCAIQFWLGLRFKNFVMSVGIGIAGWFFGTLLVVQMKLGLPEYIPYSFHMYASFKEFKHPQMQQIHFTSLGYAVLFLIIGFLNFKNRRMTG